MSFKQIFLSSCAVILLHTAFPPDCFAQEKYFRYFEVEVKARSEMQSESIREVFSRHSHMSLEAVCPDKNRLVIAVDASYPKRIEAMEEEITAAVGEILKTKNIQSVRTVPATERGKNCR